MNSKFGGRNLLITSSGFHLNCQGEEVFKDLPISTRFLHIETRSCYCILVLHPHGITRSFLRTYFEWFQMHLKNTIKLCFRVGIVIEVQSLFLHNIPDLWGIFIVIMAYILHTQFSVKCVFLWKPCLLKFLPNIDLAIWIHTFSNFHDSPIKVLF